MIISWNTTRECNLRCRHCYRDAGTKEHGELTTQEGKELLAEIAKSGFKILIFSGGEPLMRFDIFQLVEHARKLGLRPVFGSNGTLITRGVAQRLKDAGAAGIGISLDSLDAQKHDNLRGMKGAWRQALAGMDNCRAVGLPFQIHTTVFDWNDHEFEAIADAAVERGAAAFHIFFLVPAGRGKDMAAEVLEQQRYERLLHRIIAHQQVVPIELKPTCAPQFMRIAQQQGVNLRFTKGCLAGTAYCCITPQGDVHPCPYWPMKIGNVRETAFSEIWQNNAVFRSLREDSLGGYCGHCRYAAICGGCRARSYYYENGDYMAADPWCLFRGDDCVNG
jgi:putative heme d1 biosynthesis radical SAM protein NirJ2